MVRLSDGIFKNRARKGNASNASKTQPDTSGDVTDEASMSSSGRSSGGLFRNRIKRKQKKNNSVSDAPKDGIYDEEIMKNVEYDAPKNSREVESGHLSDDSFHNNDNNTRWSVMPDSRISGGPKKKTGGMMHTYAEEDSELFYTSEHMYTNEEVEEDKKDSEEEKKEEKKESPKVTKKKKKKKGGDESANGPSEGKVKKKKKKSGSLTDAADDDTVSTKKKKKKKKKSASVEAVKEKIRKHSANQKSLKDRIRVSLAILGDKGGLLSNDELNKMSVDSPVGSNAPLGIEAITEEEEEEEEVAEEEEEEEETSAHTTPSKALISPASSTSPSADQSVVQKFRESCKRVQDIRRQRQSAVDDKFASIFESNARNSLNKGLMTESDKETVNKLLADLQEYEKQLKEERDEISEARDMMQLQQEAVEHLLETETMKTQELESRIFELEELLENQHQRQETEELLMKVQRLEAEIERQQETINNMASAQQDGLKRTDSKKPWRTDSTRGNSDLDDSTITDFGDESRDSVISISNVPNPKLQGELLKLRSSVSHKEKVVEEQAKEIARLRAQLENSEEVQKMQYLEATCEDFRNESKQFRSEVDKLKKQLAEMEALRKDDLAKIEAMKQAELENKEALRKLEVQNLLNNGSRSLPGLDEAARGKEVKSANEEKLNHEQPSDEKEKEEGFNWFGFGKKDNTDESSNLLEEETNVVPELPANSIRLSNVLDF